MCHTDNSSLIPYSIPDHTLAEIGQLANQHAVRGIMTDYLSRKASSTIRRAVGPGERCRCGGVTPSQAELN
jgi:hypothetical protein